ncbi:MAG TPA: PLP-dependent aspartate aminotransferase family protein [Planctomycetota bacterium]
MARKTPHFDTRSIHSGEPRPRPDGAVVLPIYQSSTYEFRGEGDYHDVRYLRLSNNPNQVALGDKLADLEGAEAAFVTASGMAAITAALLAHLRQGDHLLAQDCLYGGTHGFVTHDLPGMGVTHSLVPGDDPAAWRAALRPETKVFYVETLSNPLLQVPLLEEVVAFAKEHGLLTIIDNTFASPVNFRPAEHGYDLVVESATKYLNGHSDIVAGLVAGRAAPVAAAKHKLDHLGGSLDPHACFLLHRGLKTLGLRVRHQNASAVRIAAAFAAHPAVACVHHPSLPDHPGHARAARLFAGGSGMLSFELHGGAEAAERMFSELQLPVVAPSLGGPETLVVRPALAVHVNLTPAERAASGIADGLVRLSVGLEDPADLIADFERAFEAAAIGALQ